LGIQKGRDVSKPAKSPQAWMANTPEAFQNSNTDTLRLGTSLAG
jgi:hypothetical protein